MISFGIILAGKTWFARVPRRDIVIRWLGADKGLKVSKMCGTKRYRDDSTDLLTVRALHVTVTVTNAVLNGHKK